MSEFAIRVLGPVEIGIGDRTVRLGSRNVRRLLAALVISINRAVPVDLLIFAIWNGDPPASALGVVHTYISRLRRLLGPEHVVLEDHAYALVIDPSTVDMVAFERLARRAADTVGEDPETTTKLCSEALGMWRGAPFGELADEEFVRLEADRLEEIRLSVIELELEAELALGRHRQIIGFLETAVEEHPYRERLWYMLMTAMARDGRRVEALRAYRHLQDVLASAGLEPTEDLRNLEERILMEDDDLRAELTPNRPAARKRDAASHPAR